MKKISIILIAVIVMMSFGKAFAQQNRDQDRSRDREEMKQKWKSRQNDQQDDRGQGGKRGGPGGPGGSMIDRFINNPQIVERLNFTDDQLAKLKKLSEQSKAKQEELMTAMKEVGMKQAELMMSDEVDRKALKEAVQETGKIRTEIGWLKTEELLALKEILTKEQSQTMKDMRKHHQQNMQNQGGDRRGGSGDRRGGSGDRRGGSGDRRGGSDDRRGGDDNQPPPPGRQGQGGDDMFTM